MGTSTDHRSSCVGGNVTGHVVLQTNSWLLSEAATGHELRSRHGHHTPPGPSPRPAVNGTQRALTGSVTVGNDSNVRGVDLHATRRHRRPVGLRKRGLVVNQMSITTSNARAVDLANSAASSRSRASSATAQHAASPSSTPTFDGSFTITGSGTAGSGGTINASTGTAIGEAGIYSTTRRPCR
jgi:hypothetical protein